MMRARPTPAAHPQRRAAVLGLAALLTANPKAARAYGGRGVATALDAGSGNVFYDDLAKRAKENGAGMPSVPNTSPNEGATEVARKRCGPECQKAKGK